MQIINNVDFNKLQALNLRLQVLAVAPSSPVSGLVYFDSAQSKFGYYSGSAWVYGDSLSFQNSGPVSWTRLADSVSLTIAAATTSTAGLLSAADKTKLDGATSANTASTIVIRDPSGNFVANVITASQISGLTTPTQDNQAATKGYVDAVAQGLRTKDSVRVATTANVALTGAQTIDGIALSAGNRVLVKDQTTASQNGIWIVAAGAWTRSVDLAIGSSAKSVYTFIEEGLTNADSAWNCTNDNGSDIVGSSNLNFTQFSGAGQITAGLGLTKTGNTLNIGAGDMSIIINADDIRVRVDNATLEVDATVGVRVKDEGITAAKIAAGAIGTGLERVGGAIRTVNYTPVSGTTVARKITLTANIGGSSAVTFTHNLNTRDLHVQVKDATTDEPLICDWAVTGVNTISVTAAVATFSAKVVIIG